jgi:hypothetical protein
VIVIINGAARIFGDIPGGRHQQRRAFKPQVGMIQLAIALEVHSLVAVDEDFRHRRIIQ